VAYGSETMEAVISRYIKSDEVNETRIFPTNTYAIYYELGDYTNGNVD